MALALTAQTAPAVAQQTGGSGGAAGGAGGSTSATDGTATAGGNSGNIDLEGAGGGGAGVTGGAGGNGANPGGTGGATPGADGSDGVFGGGGGGGGAHGATSFPLSGPVKGGNGGNGAVGVGGGGGGGGGYGVFVTGTNVSVTATQTITGGNGGNGGQGENGGAGGAGGVGVFFAGSATLINQSAIQGGNGGAAGGPSAPGGNDLVGAAGAGVVGANLTIDNTAGTIAAGSDGNAIPVIGDAIRFTGGANVLTLAGTGGLTGNIAITAAGSTVTFNQSADVTLANVITGSGGVIQSAAGTLTLTGNNAYTGGTTITAGTLQIGNGGGTGAITGDVTNNAALVFNRANDMTFSGVMSGSGTMTKTGSGQLTLTGTSTYAGVTTVDGGILTVNGSIASSSMTVVNASGTLGGIGTVGNTVIDGGTLGPGSTYNGQIGPGNFTGLLTVQGDLVMTSAATYRVDVSPGGASRVNVTGTADLGGATVNANFAPGSYVKNNTTIVNATGGLGGTTFGAVVNTNLPTGFKTGLSYDANHAYLNLTLDLTSLGAAPSGNHGNVGRVVTDFFNRTGGIPLAFGALDAKGLSQAAGEIGPGGQQTSFNAANQFMGVMTDPFAAGRDIAPTIGAVPYADEAMAYAPKRAPTDAFASMHRKAPVVAPQDRWNVWAAGFGGSQTTDGNAVAGTGNSKSSIYGMAVGADYWFSPLTVAGVSMAGGGTNFSVDGGGSGRSDLFQLGGFIRHTMGSVYLSAAAAYGWQDITTDRYVTVAGIDHLRANFNANSYSGRVEIGNRFAMQWVGGIGLTPYGAVQVTAFDLPSYAESTVSGTNTFALAYAGKTITSTRSELGLRSDKSFALSDAILTLRGRAAWAHDYNTDRSASATFQSLPGASFTVNGATPARNAALTTASAELKWMNGWSVAGTFEGEFSDVTRSYAGKGVVRYAW